MPSNYDIADELFSLPLDSVIGIVDGGLLLVLVELGDHLVQLVTAFLSQVSKLDRQDPVVVGCVIEPGTVHGS